MKKSIKNIFFLLTLIAMIGIATISCDREEYTGYSTLVPTSPTITVTPAFTSPLVLTEDNTKHKVTVTLSEPQVADIKLYISQIDGTADASDYVVTNSVVIPVGSTSASAEIQILSDDIKEETETLTLQIGDAKTANASLTPVNVMFEIHNLTADDLTVGMSWETDVAESVGLDLDPTEAVDLRLLLVDSNGEIVDVADGSSFEELVLAGADLDDGEYRIATDLYSTINAGDYNALITLDIQLNFSQVGLIDTLISLPQAMTNQFVCENYRVYLASVTKTGSTYSLKKALAHPSSPHTGKWFGTDGQYLDGGAYVYPESKVETKIGCAGFLIYGLNNGWISDFWGEEVIDEGEVVYTFDQEAGTVNIDRQYAFTTLYSGAEYPYEIEGTGTLDVSGEYATMTITYELFQDGFSPSQWGFENGYMESTKFTAVLTLAPPRTMAVGMLKTAKLTSSSVSASPGNVLINKPKR